MYSRNRDTTDTLETKKHTPTYDVPYGYGGSVFDMPTEISLDDEAEPVNLPIEHEEKKSGLSKITEILGFGGGVNNDELLLCALILSLASDKFENTSDIVLLLSVILAAG